MSSRWRADSPKPRHARPARVLVALVAAALVAGLGACGADEPAKTAGGAAPDGAASTDPAAEGGEADRLADEVVFTFELPEGDTNVSTNAALVYRRMLDHDCAGAQAVLDRTWWTFRGVREVLLYQAAVHLCAGDVAAAAPFYRAATGFGASGLEEDDLECLAYLAVAEVVEQRPKDSFSCLPGAVDDAFATGCRDVADEDDGSSLRRPRRLATPDPPGPSTTRPSSSTASSAPSTTSTTVSASSTTASTEATDDPDDPDRGPIERTRCDPRRDVSR